MPARLIILAGLPGSGKSTLAQSLCARTRATWLRIDTIENGLRDLCAVDVTGEGYRLAYRVAADNLRLGIDVVADSCNPIGLTRDEWRGVAKDAGATAFDVEIACSDPFEHRRRVEARRAANPGGRHPTWEAVVNRVYDPFPEADLHIDTASSTVEAAVESILCALPPR